MKLLRLFALPILAAAVGLPLFAQDQPGTIAALEFQTPKNGMVSQYEAGRKVKALWHKQQNDPGPLFVWQIISGDSAGTYIVGSLGHHWKDFDNPPISDAADLEEFNKVIGQYVASVIPRYYEFLPKLSDPPDSMMPPPMSEIIIFQIREGKMDDFMSLIGRVGEAIKKTNWGAHAEWYALANGGNGGEIVLSLPRQKWADFEPPAKPFPAMLEEAYGRTEAESILKRIDACIESSRSEIIKFRADLSYIPGK